MRASGSDMMSGHQAPSPSPLSKSSLERRRKSREETWRQRGGEEHEEEEEEKRGEMRK